MKIKNNEIECFLCGKVHKGECKPEDREAVLRFIEEQNKCSWCGKFSEKSELHPKCRAAEEKWMDEEKAFDAWSDSQREAEVEKAREQKFEANRSVWCQAAGFAK